MSKNHCFALPKISKDGYSIILITALITLFLGIFSTIIGLIGFILTIFFICFFRDPDRIIHNSDALITSPADGVVVEVEDVNSFPAELELGEIKLKKISIFLSIFNVHVNRIPTTGTIRSLLYIPGVFSNAFFDKSSFKNERQITLIETEEDKIAMVQIAGLAARRVICRLHEGQKVEQGDRFGIIKFGSRVDIYVPQKYAIHVVKGHTVIGGESILATKNGPAISQEDFKLK